MLDERSWGSRWRQMTRRHAWWVTTTALYSLIMSATTARGMADTIDYASSIEGALRGAGREFWEFGHLLWRPLGYLSYRFAHPLIQRLFGLDSREGIIAVLLAWNWLAGLAGVLSLNRFVSRLGARPRSVGVITLAYLMSYGILNYAHSGSSYIPGLACLLVALALLADREMSLGTAIVAGVALACAVGFWALYILVIPAALAVPLVWFGPERCRLLLVGVVTVSFVLLLGSAYLLAIDRLGIRDLGSLRAWVTESSHGIANIRGLSRVAFGVPRSFLSMDKDGILYKRFLLKDPYNPVTLSELIRLSLAKITLFYTVLFVTLVGLLRERAGRRLLVLAVLGGLPVLAFAVGWQGGDVERYLPAYPLVFAAWAMILGGDRPIRLIQTLVLSLVVVLSIVNLPALSKVVVDRHRAQLELRVEEIIPSLGAEDRVYVVTIQDLLVRANRDPLRLHRRGLDVRVLIPLGYVDAPRWRDSFASDVRGVWAEGGRAWISKRVLSRRPRAEWDWVEGDEKSVPWSDLPSFFADFELGQAAGDEDGFVLLARTPHNERLLRPQPAASTDRLEYPRTGLVGVGRYGGSVPW
jgi:hypothetical protein